MTTAASQPLDLRATAREAQARVAHSDVTIPRDRRRDVARPPGPSRAAVLRRFIGGRDGPAFMVDTEREFPTIAHMRLLGEHTYVLSSPDAIVDVFIGHGRDTMKGRGLQGTKAVLGNGLLTSEGKVHLRHRRLVQPAFHRDRIAAYSRDMVDLSLAHETVWEDGRPLDMQADMSALTLTIVGRTLFGADLAASADEIGEALAGLLQGVGRFVMLGPGVLRIPTPGRRRALESFARIDQIVEGVIAQHREIGDTGDMLSMLIAAEEDGSGFTDAQVRDEAMTLILAGHETTAMTLTWTWMLLARNPEVAEWLHEELDAVLGGRAPTMDDLARLPRTRAVIAESIRLYPPAWIQGRRMLADIEVDGWTIPAGSMTLISQFALHRSPRWWDSSLTFLPQRWLDAAGDFGEDNPGQPRGAWFPFGWGNRRCIGEQFAWTEGTLVLATLAQRWRPELVSG
ncbi:MAG: cytochrome P450, partial [Candidatus Nanopelagicales bacterium]